MCVLLWFVRKRTLRSRKTEEGVADYPIGDIKEPAEISYFSFRDKATFINTAGGKQYIVDHTLDELERILDPTKFFRLNRQFIVAMHAITSVHHYFNGKLKVYVKPDPHMDIMVSKEKAPSLKKWLDE